MGGQASTPSIPHDIVVAIHRGRALFNYGYFVEARRAAVDIPPTASYQRGSLLRECRGSTKKCP